MSNLYHIEYFSELPDEKESYHVFAKDSIEAITKTMPLVKFTVNVICIVYICSSKDII